MREAAHGVAEVLLWCCSLWTDKVRAMIQFFIHVIPTVETNRRGCWDGKFSDRPQTQAQLGMHSPERQGQSLESNPRPAC